MKKYVYTTYDTVNSFPQSLDKKYTQHERTR